MKGVCHECEKDGDTCEVSQASCILGIWPHGTHFILLPMIAQNRIAAFLLRATCLFEYCFDAWNTQRPKRARIGKLVGIFGNHSYIK